MRLVRTLLASAVLAACTHVTTYPEPEPWPPTPPPPPLPDAGPPPPSGDVVALPDIPALDTRPAISGGSLAITPDGRVIAGDPDRASIWVVDPAARAVVGRVALEADDEPGRMAVDSEGRVHVVLRRSGGVLTIDPETATVIEARAVCRTPRGIAWDAARERLWVACASGELLTLGPSRSPVESVFLVDEDLRDVLVGEDRLYVSRFRSAELLEIDPDTGDVLGRRRPPDQTREILMRIEPSIAVAVANTAWRIRFDGAGDVVMLHQASVSTPIEVEMSGYSGDECGGGVVGPALSVFSADGTDVRGGSTVSNAVLAVDVAVDEASERYHVAAAATDALFMGFGMGVMAVPTFTVEERCLFGEESFTGRGGFGRSARAVELLPDGRRVTLYGDPLRVEVEGGVAFEGRPHQIERGFELFHTATPSMTACASCHPEGGEDGHVWDFVGTGVRRTQTLLGGLLETAPFHWSGDQADMSAIMMGGFMQRMGGSSTPDEARLIGEWLDAQPMPPALDQDPSAVERGRLYFTDASVGCAGCHAGEALTDNRSVDVGTGGAFQVPSLRGVAWRAPYFHDGCAESLEAVLLGACEGAHPNAAALDEAAQADLAAYLRTL